MDDDAAGPAGDLDDHERPSRVVLAVVLAFVVIVGGTVAAGAGYYSWCKGAGGVRTPVRLTVAPGTSGEQVVQQLADVDVVRCGGIVGRALAIGNDLADKVRAGTYDLTTNMTLDDALRVLSTPTPSPAVDLTIPEGYRITQIAERAAGELGIPAATFERLALRSGKYSLHPYLPAGSRSVEGFLFPDTYSFAKGRTTADEVIRTMLGQFQKSVAHLPWDNAKKLGVTPYQVVVVASMIEKEAKVPGDRPKIAAVIYNRLADGMTLGIDATLLYDDPSPDGRLSAADLQHSSPYNTRLRAGLPPTPIASPGIPSLQAALHPAKVPYLYYVLCGSDGHHRFSTTYSQFLRDEAACLG